MADIIMSFFLYPNFMRIAKSLCSSS